MSETTNSTQTNPLSEFVPNLEELLLKMYSTDLSDHTIKCVYSVAMRVRETVEILEDKRYGSLNKVDQTALSMAIKYVINPHRGEFWSNASPKTLSEMSLDGLIDVKVVGGEQQVISTTALKCLLFAYFKNKYKLKT